MAKRKARRAPKRKAGRRPKKRAAQRRGKAPRKPKRLTPGQKGAATKRRNAHAERLAHEFNRRSRAAKRGWETRRGFVPQGTYHYSEEGPWEVGEASAAVADFFYRVDRDRKWDTRPDDLETWWVWTASGSGRVRDMQDEKESITVGTSHKASRSKSEDEALHLAGIYDDGQAYLNALGRYGLTWERMEIWVSVEEKK